MCNLDFWHLSAAVVTLPMAKGGKGQEGEDSTRQKTAGQVATFSQVS